MKKLLIGLMAFASFAATAASFSYQGVLKNADGTNFADTNRNPEITFRLYTVPTGGTALWERTIKVLLDKDGLFNVELSDSTEDAVAGLANTLDQVLSQYGDSALYIGMEVDKSTGEIRPRQKMPAVPLASFAQDVKTARGDFKIEGNATISGALTVEKDVTIKGNANLNGIARITEMEVLNEAKLMIIETVITNLTVTNDVEIKRSLKVGGNDVLTSIPKGLIVAWNGTTDDIPVGWTLCNGNDDTPDLRELFIMGGREKGTRAETKRFAVSGQRDGPFIRYYAPLFIMKK